MYINAFWAGVAATLLATCGLLVGWAIVELIRERRRFKRKK
jgi:hypothetical protein